MTQSDLAAAVGYSTSFISSLEKEKRLPDLGSVAQHFVPALGLQDEPYLAARLVEQAAAARNMRLPAPLMPPRRTQVIIPDRNDESLILLPIPPTVLIGREPEVQKLCNRLLGHRGRLLTLVGPPGVGKTRLSLEIAARMAPFYRDGACFVALAAVPDAAHVTSVIVAELGITGTLKKSPLSRLIEYLRRREFLLVLDNFEHLLVPPLATTDLNSHGLSCPTQSTDIVAKILTNCPNVHILVTSRERLHLRAEQRCRVAPLVLESAIDLFIQRAQDVESDFTATESNCELVALICRQLDCLPLAIELAAAHVDMYPPQQLLALLREQRLDLLADGANDLPSHQNTLRAAMDASYMLLTSSEQALLCALSVFVGGFNWDVVAHLGFARRDLEALINKSLVTRVSSDDLDVRFAMLATLREFAAEQLAARGEEATARERHAAYYGALVTDVRDKIAGANGRHGLDQLEAEYDNIRAGLQWLLDSDPPRALVLATALGEFWYARGYLVEPRDWLLQILARNPEPTPQRGRALTSAAIFVKLLGDIQSAHNLLAEALIILRASDDRAGQANVLREQGWTWLDFHDRPQAIAAFEQSLALFRTLDDPCHVAEVLAALAHAVYQPGDDDNQPSAWLNEAVDLYRGAGYTDGLAFVLNQLGALQTLTGRYTEAVAKHLEALACARAHDENREVAATLELLGEAYWLQGAVDSADKYWTEGHALALTLGDQEQIMLTWHHLGQIARVQGRLTQATRCYVESLRSCWVMKNERMVARCLAGLGGVALAGQAFEKAARLLGAAFALFDLLPPFLAPADQHTYTEMVDVVHNQLDDDLFWTLWEEGKEASPTQVVEKIIADITAIET